MAARINASPLAVAQMRGTLSAPLRARRVASTAVQGSARISAFGKSRQMPYLDGCSLPATFASWLAVKASPPAVGFVVVANLDREFAVNSGADATRNPGNSWRKDGGHRATTIRAQAAILAPPPPVVEEAEAVTDTGGGGTDGGSFRGGNGEGGGNNGDGRWSGGSGGGAGAGGDEGGRADFGALLGWPRVEAVLLRKGVTLPEDMLLHAREHGISEVMLQRFMDLQNSALGPAISNCAALRNRLLMDPSFLFKVFTEIAIDCGCATFAEVQKRGDDFWKEFDLYLSDMLVGVILGGAVVGSLAPAARFATSAGGGRLPRILPRGVSAALSALPSSVFEASLPGHKFSAAQRSVTLFVKGVEYAGFGFASGLVGQGIANGVMNLKSNMRQRNGESAHTEDSHVKPPPLFKTALLWGAFMAISSNPRYQVVTGLERLVDGSAVARSLPWLSGSFTVAVRFANNIYGSSQFVDWARLAGVQ
ncbi:hypothetical protein CLOM_g23155 [Closterium sp. NIES-68]|nr:hypothetical protein CLOM_g23155 [Closterium sp. NIES-68]GJP66421.1 hypothetical protein CLOP_g23356 [Closterium sp. NIES-67]GJP80234.1 hypothetical protein CLOP_g10467 [Closterium sp. NIES-67]